MRCIEMEEASARAYGGAYGAQPMRSQSLPTEGFFRLIASSSSCSNTRARRASHKRNNTTRRTTSTAAAATMPHKGASWMAPRDMSK